MGFLMISGEIILLFRLILEANFGNDRIWVIALSFCIGRSGTKKLHI